MKLKPASDGVSFTKGVRRWNCKGCGSPMMASFDYLPDQIYAPLGLLDQADQLIPEIHCHKDAQMPWLHLDDGLPGAPVSARDVLRKFGDV